MTSAESDLQKKKELLKENEGSEVLKGDEVSFVFIIASSGCGETATGSVAHYSRIYYMAFWKIFLEGHSGKS